MKRKFKVLKVHSDDVVSAYGCNDIKVGKTIKLSGYFADKCAANPDFEEILISDKSEDNTEDN